MTLALCQINFNLVYFHRYRFSTFAEYDICISGYALYQKYRKGYLLFFSFGLGFLNVDYGVNGFIFSLLLNIFILHNLTDPPPPKKNIDKSRGFVTINLADIS